MTHKPYVSPIEQSLRSAEAAIDHMVLEPGAKWDVASHNWVVGGNVAVVPQNDAAVFVTQALGPEAKADQAYYSAKTPEGTLYWRAGATALHQVLRDPTDAKSGWTNVQQAQRALGAVSSAVALPPQ